MSNEATRMYSDVEKRLEREGWLDWYERAEHRAWELLPYWVDHETELNYGTAAGFTLSRHKGTST